MHTKLANNMKLRICEAKNIVKLSFEYFREGKAQSDS